MILRMIGIYGCRDVIRRYSTPVHTYHTYSVITVTYYLLLVEYTIAPHLLRHGRTLYFSTLVPFMH